MRIIATAAVLSAALLTALAPAAAALPTGSGGGGKPAPTITGCQEGFGPIKTYWSDGTQTGWSQHCQDVHDETLRLEVEANQRPRSEPSGVIQMRHGCEQGYIDTETCREFYERYPR